jgi:crossover junction endodeoxyribonuclease RuvC
MRVLGVDPGLRVSGYGCIEFASNTINPTVKEAGAIRLDTQKSVSFRLKQLYEDLVAIIEELKPELLAVEKVFTHEEHLNTATILGHSRGVILLAGEQANLPLIELAPAEIKKSVTGNGRASKDQIQQAVTSILMLSETPKPHDVADALAIAITAGIRDI